MYNLTRQLNMQDGLIRIVHPTLSLFSAAGFNWQDFLHLVWFF